MPRLASVSSKIAWCQRPVLMGTIGTHQLVGDLDLVDRQIDVLLKPRSYGRDEAWCVDMQHRSIR
jgi:hypothetical protein